MQDGPKPGEYHFTVPLPGGKRLRAAIVPLAIERPAPASEELVEASGEFAQLEWETSSLEHGGEVGMSARAPDLEGKTVCFVVEHNHGGSWAPYAKIEAVVSDGWAKGTLRVHHPALPPTGEVDAKALLSVAAADLRFHMAVGKGHPQPKAEPKVVKATSKAGPQVEHFTELRWVSQKRGNSFEHGDDLELEVKATGIDGRKMRFVVEHEEDGKWTEYAKLDADVKDGKATAKLRVHHPVLPPTGNIPAAAELKKAKEAKLRFHAELA